MKQMFKSLTELAATLEGQARAKEDFVAPARSLVMHDNATLSGHRAVEQAVNSLGHQQIAEYAGIPKPYYDKLLASDGGKPVLARDVNHWLRSKPENERRMVRTLHGEVRALLSDRYQRIDNYEVAEVALNVLSKVGGLRIASSAVTESRLYIKAVSQNVEMKVPGSARVGDLVQAGVLVSNSEVGQGSVSIKPFAEFLVCTNGMVRDKAGLRAAHIGRRIDADIEGLLTDGTRRLEDELVLRKVKDVIAHAFDRAAFERFMEQLGATTQQRIEGDVPAAVQALGPTLGLTQGEQSGVLRHLIEGGDLSRYGLMNAVTRTAEDVESYDRATELEAAGFRLIELPKRDWDVIAMAKPKQAALA